MLSIQAGWCGSVSREAEAGGSHIPGTSLPLPACEAVAPHSSQNPQHPIPPICKMLEITEVTPGEDGGSYCHPHSAPRPRIFLQPLMSQSPSGPHRCPESGASNPRTVVYGDHPPGGVSLSKGGERWLQSPGPTPGGHSTNLMGRSRATGGVWLLPLGRDKQAERGTRQEP